MVRSRGLGVLLPSAVVEVVVDDRCNDDDDAGVVVMALGITGCCGDFHSTTFEVVVQVVIRYARHKDGRTVLTNSRTDTATRTILIILLTYGTVAQLNIR